MSRPSAKLPYILVGQSFSPLVVFEDKVRAIPRNIGSKTANPNIVKTGINGVHSGPKTSRRASTVSVPPSKHLTLLKEL